MDGVASAKVGIDREAPPYRMPRAEVVVPFVVAMPPPPPPPPEPTLRTSAEEVVWIVKEDDVERVV